MTDPRDDDLVALYRQLPRSEPPAALDAAVLAGARAAVRPRRPAWLAPLAAAAVLVLAVGVGWQLRHEPLRETTPAAAPATSPAAGSAADAATVDVPEATSAIGEAKTEAARANRVEAAPAPQAAAPQPAAPAVAAEAESMAAPAGADAGSEATTAPASAKRAPREERDDERLEEIVVTGSRVEAPRQRTIATPPPPAAEPLTPPVADVAEAPAPPPAPPAPPVPRAAPEPTTATAAQGLSAERAPAAPPVTDTSGIAALFDEIRALRDAGRRDEAVAALARLVEAHPALEIPEDLRDLRD